MGLLNKIRIKILNRVLTGLPTTEKTGAKRIKQQRYFVHRVNRQHRSPMHPVKETKGQRNETLMPSSPNQQGNSSSSGILLNNEVKD